MKTGCLFLLLLAFAFLPYDLRLVGARQPGDDPNWRERQLEELRNKSEVLRKKAQELEEEFKILQHEAAIAQWERLSNKLQRRPRWLDRWDYGPISSEYRSNLFPHR
jgi:hypothetical protein